MSARRGICLGAVVCAVMLLAGGAMAQPVPADAEIRTILAERIDVGRRSVGMVVGVIEPPGRRVVAHGQLEHGDPRPLDGDTLFEIGSVTKVFTSLLLADMVRRGDLALDDPVAKHLPAGFELPQRDGRAITLVDLATHTSALPRMPANFAPANPGNPYVDYTLEQLRAFLSDHVLRRDIGAFYEYSNLGVALLGQAVAHRAGIDYEGLVRSRITEPLRMASTRIALSPELAGRLARGHDSSLATVPNWDLPTFSGAGALRSTANDLLVFLAAHLGAVETPLAPAMADMLEVRRPIAGGGEIALGWHILKRKDREIVWHNGQTGGYSAFVGYDRQARTGVVVLSNAAVESNDLGFHLLDASVPLRKVRTAVAVDPAVLEGYVGRYQVTPSFILTVTREGARLFVQATSQARYEVFAESEHSYFYRVVDARITFETDSQGRALRLILHQNGRDVLGRRLD